MALIRRLRERIAFFRWYVLEYRPMAGAEDDPPPPDPAPDPKDDPEPNPDPDPDPVKPDDDWKAKARKHEAAMKRERKQREEAERKLAERETESQSEHEKALAKAREEARAEALTEAEKERRSDRLEVGVTRLAAKGFEIGEDDDKKTVRFADSEDALLHIERAIARGEIEADDIFDDEGKVNADALQSELEQLLERKPHLAAGEAERPKPKGDPGLRKGGPASTDLESMTPEDHAKRKYGAKN